MQHYHAHVYFDLTDEATIESFIQDAQDQNCLRIWKLFRHRVGPHAKPMVELHFSKETYSEAITWLEDHRQGLSILVHEDTGDDYRDHTVGALWLGDPLPIDFNFFDQIKQNPGMAIHSK